MNLIKDKMLNSKTFGLFLLVFAAFLLLTGFRLFAEGMFLDGVTYAAISRNLADGMGSFWTLYLSDALYPQFHEHPPLAFGMQSIAFRLFGDHLLVERLYSIGTFFLTGYLIYLIWLEITRDKKTSWIPLFLWILFPLNTWAAASNLLDNTLMVFSTLAILFILKSSSRDQPGWLFFAGIALFAGILTKGPFALFPWVLPFLCELSTAPTRFRKSISRSGWLIFYTLIPLALLLVFSEQARVSLQAYWLKQVVGSIGGVQTVSSRFYILMSLLLQIAIPLFVSLATLLVFRKSIVKNGFNPYRKTLIILLLLGLAGVIPVMISLKQSSFYILSSLPVFALMLALPVFAFLKDPLSRVKATPNSIRIFNYSAITLFVLSVIISPMMAKYNHRDQDELQMIHHFNTFIPERTTIRIHPTLFTDWSLHSYFARHAKISLDPSEGSIARFYLTKEELLPNDTLSKSFSELSHLNGFVLFQK
jgi:4-amino-4-deoxy-L-arabinose transferase-like glycosyltransferase